MDVAEFGIKKRVSVDLGDLHKDHVIFIHIGYRSRSFSNNILIEQYACRNTRFTKQKQNSHLNCDNNLGMVIGFDKRNLVSRIHLKTLDESLPKVPRLC